MVEVEETLEPAPANSDWDAAWTDDEVATTDGVGNSVNGENDGVTPNRHSVEETRRHSVQVEDADAWGWGEDDDDAPEVEGLPIPEQEPAAPSPSPPKTAPKLLQKTITEKYWTSSLPQPILKTIDEIFNDGARLLNPEYVCLSSRLCSY